MKMLKNKKSINKLFENGKYLSSKNILIKFLESNEPMFLFTTSSKKFKKAVDRNRIKRLMKASVISKKFTNKNIAFIYIGNKIPTFKEIDDSLFEIENKLK